MILNKVQTEAILKALIELNKAGITINTLNIGPSVSFYYYPKDSSYEVVDYHFDDDHKAMEHETYVNLMDFQAAYGLI